MDNVLERYKDGEFSPLYNAVQLSNLHMMLKIIFQDMEPDE